MAVISVLAAASEEGAIALAQKLRQQRRDLANQADSKKLARNKQKIDGELRELRDGIAKGVVKPLGRSDI